MLLLATSTTSTQSMYEIVLLLIATVKIFQYGTYRDNLFIRVIWILHSQ